ncbi:MAG: hypothetical protein ACETWQ_22750 [Phycisphaerae bacterium]
MKQLLLSKFLFQKGEDALDLRTSLACGVAISQFQDAVEMFLWTTIKEKNINFRGRQMPSA